MAKTTTTGIIGLDTNYVGMTAHGPMRVGDVLARFERAEEAVLYGGSRLWTLDKAAAKKAAEQGKSAPATTPAPTTPARAVKAAKAGKYTHEQNSAAYKAWLAAGKPGDWHDMRAAMYGAPASSPAPTTPASAPTPAPVKAARKPRKSTAKQVEHRAKFAAFTAENRARKAAGQPAIAWADFTAPAPAPTPAPVVTYQTVTATKPTTRARAKAVPAPVVTQPDVPVAREVTPASTSDDAILDWIIAQPEPLRVGMRDLAGAFPSVSNNRKLAALRAVKELAA